MLPVQHQRERESKREREREREREMWTVSKTGRYSDKTKMTESV